VVKIQSCTCGKQRKAFEFLQVWCQQQSQQFDISSIQNAFIQRFASEVRSRAARARDALLNRQIRRTLSSCVQDYASMFKQHTVHTPEMHENDKIRFFQQGLTPQLRTECIVDQNGKDFTSLDNVIQFAVGQERHISVMQQVNPRFARLNYTRGIEDDAPPKKQKLIPIRPVQRPWQHLFVAGTPSAVVPQAAAGAHTQLQHQLLHPWWSLKPWWSFRPWWVPRCIQ
jgi:hypothetical protein